MKYGIVVIAASAGGITAVGELLSGLPADFPVPILIVQHRSYSRSMLESIFRNRTSLSVTDAKEGDTPVVGSVYVAPPDLHLLLDEKGVLCLSDSPKVNFVRPAADLLFASAANVYRERTIGVVLTGYGVDGSHGVEEISRMGGYVIAQEPMTSEASRMPSAAIHTGCVDATLPLNEIGPALLDLLSA